MLPVQVDRLVPLVFAVPKVTLDPPVTQADPVLLEARERQVFREALV